MEVDMELRTVISFLRVAELENFTKAASDLGYVQSTVSMQIKQLEEELGFRLFDRIGKRVILTQKGHEFLPLAGELMKTLHQVDQLKSPGDPSGTLRIGILESLFYWIFAPSFPVFHTWLPDVTVEVKTASGTDLFSMLKHGDIDLVYLLDHKIVESDCIRCFSHPINLVFAASSENPICLKPHLSLSEVLSYPLLLTERNGIYRKALERAAHEKDLLVSPLLEADNTCVLVNMVRNNIGISYLPEYTVQKSVEHGDICILPIDDFHLQFWCQIFVHKNKWITSQMEKFIELIRKHYET